MIVKYPVCRASVLVLVVSCVLGCERDLHEYQSYPYEPAPYDLIVKMVDKGWLDANCARVDMSALDYPDCVRVKRTLMEPLDEAKLDEFGEYYNPKKYYDCRLGKKPGIANCEIHALRRNEPKPVWPNPNVPPLEWPSPPQPVYRGGMSSVAYFEALCESESGKFIYQTVENVHGIYQIRPRYPKTNYELYDLYVLEDPYHQNLAEARSEGALLVGPNGYSYWETSLYEPERRWRKNKEWTHESIFTRPTGEQRFIVFYGYDGRENKSKRKRYSDKLNSRYGYIWRGIRRPHDRENFIAGGELAIVDLRTNKILALWRGFRRTVRGKRGRVWWQGAAACPALSITGESMAEFIKTVLKPAAVRSSTQSDVVNR